MSEAAVSNDKEHKAEIPQQCMLMMTWRWGVSYKGVSMLWGTLSERWTMNVDHDHANDAM